VLSGGGPWNTLSRPERPLQGDQPGVPATRKFISRDYFSTLDVGILAGRAFGPDDGMGTPPVMVLSEPLAQDLFPGENPVGKPVTLWGQSFEVVGVAQDVAEAGLGEALSRPAFFLSLNQFPGRSLQLLVRVTGQDPASVTGSLRAALKDVDPDIALTGVETMAAGISGTLAQPRFQTGLVGAFAVVGLLLAAFGLYGVLAYLVTRRNREIGIRMALGAEAGNLLNLILREGMGMVGVGAVLGLLAGGGISVLIRGFLVGVSPADPMALLGSGMVLLLAGFVATLGPAYRAVRTDPLTALRTE
jgi:ABC-type antimicrobial peptide transport system permease subunit